MRNFHSEGTVVTVTAPDAVAPGNLVKIGSLVGVAVTGATSGKEVPVRVEGVFHGLATTGSGFTAGAAIYYSDSASALTTTASGNSKVGVSLGNGLVRLNGSF